jgi:hypothetical protein
MDSGEKNPNPRNWTRLPTEKPETQTETELIRPAVESQFQEGTIPHLEPEAPYLVS